MSRSKRFKVLFFSLVAVLVIALLLVVSGNLFRSQASIPENQLTKVKRADLSLAVVATGSIVPVATVEVKSKASGLVKKVLVEAGDPVHFGQVLVELDRELLEAQLRETQATRQAVAAGLEESRIEATGKAVARARAELAQADAALDRARENLRHATITSFIDGTVLKRHVEVGDAVSSILQLGSQATLMLTLKDMTQVFFEGRVDETDIGKVYVGQKAHVKVDAYQDRSLPGAVLRIAPLGEKEDKVVGFEVRVSIDDSQKILRAEMSANAEIIVEKKKDILTIPESCVIYDRQRQTFAEMPDVSAQEKKRRVPIQIKISDGSVIEVVASLNEGDQVVKNGYQRDLVGKVTKKTTPGRRPCKSLTPCWPTNFAPFSASSELPGESLP